MVEAGLAACVNILSPCRSVYRWQGNMQVDAEIPLLIKTSADRFPDLQAWIRQQHPYELPELVAVNIADGLPPYLDWIAQSTLTERSSG